MTDEIKTEDAENKPKSRAKAAQGRNAKTESKTDDGCEGVCATEGFPGKIEIPTPKLGMHGFLRKQSDIAVAQIIGLDNDGTFVVDYKMKSTTGRMAWQKDVRMGVKLNDFWPDLETLQTEIAIERAARVAAQAN